MNLSIRICFLLLALVGCVTTTPDDAGANVATLREVVAQWSALQSPEQLEQVRVVVEQQLPLAGTSPELDLELGNALANILLRPDLGLPLLEKRLGTPGQQRHEYLVNALMRSHPNRFADQVHVLTGVTLALDHPTTITLLAQASVDSRWRWRELVHAYESAVLLEQGLKLRQSLIDLPVERLEILLSSADLLLNNWQLQYVVGRSTTPIDPDPMLEYGFVVAQAGRRVVVNYQHDSPGVAGQKIGQFIDQNHPLHTVSIVIRAVSPEGSGFTLALEGKYVRDLFVLFGTNDRARTAILLSAAADLPSLGSIDNPEPSDLGEWASRHSNRFIEGG